ncbi:MAG TPA: hypothetical protein VND65_12850 [Candidatus Binatia bacterium]|nr:hypothetical protein [Candidatus Binatia bacterium]
MLTRNAKWLRLVVTIVLLSGNGGWAQEASSRAPAESIEEKTSSQKEKPLMEAYHLDFSLNELEDGKKINTRQYSTDLATNEGNEIKIGTRVPMQVKDGEFQYLDIGTNIFARLSETRGQTELVVRAELSNFAVPEHDPHEVHPIIRQMKIGGSTLLPVSKTIVIGSADDPNSKRQFQLEVTVTKLR